MIFEYSYDFSELRQIAICAGNEILKIYNSTDFNIEIKKDKSPLTKADRLANVYICKKLKEIYPSIPILSEENEQIEYSERSHWNDCFIVDPLDGTKEFIKQNGEFTVNIAYVRKGKVLEGVVYAPVIKTLYFSQNGKSYKSVDGSKPISLPCTKSKTFKVVASRSHLSGKTLKFVEELKIKHPNAEVVHTGSSLKLCLVAEGNANIYPRLASTMEWDTAAAHAIVIGAGKNVYSVDTEKPLMYNKKELLNPHFVVR